MLFIIRQTHDYATCHAHDEEKLQKTQSAVNGLADKGVKLHAMYNNRLEHTAYMVIESDTMEAIDEAFDGVLELGSLGNYTSGAKISYTELRGKSGITNPYY